jgi:uncharacterized protein with PIN domain
MKFIADVMLGRLAKRLRLLGFDVVYSPDLEDRRIVRLAREEDRIVLTRDRELAKRRGLRGVVLIESDKVSDQLLQMKDSLDFDSAASLGRCVRCNGPLFRISRKSDVRDSVPDYVYFNLDLFLRCGGCGKVYWKGSHYDRFMEEIRDTVKERIED